MKPFFYLFFFLIFTAFLNAQTAEKLEELLNRSSLGYEEAVVFVFEAADVPNRYGSEFVSSPAAAFRFAAEQGWLPGNVKSNDTVTLDGVSLLIMHAFGLKGGILYSLLKNPHYAYRELVYQNIIQGRSDPQMAVSGDSLLLMISRIFTLGEDESWAPVPVPAQEAPNAQKEDEWQTLARDIGTKFKDRALVDSSVRITDEGVVISLNNLRFLPNSTDLADVEELREVAAILQAIPVRKIRVSGHTALAGTPQDRMQTSLERAQAVADFMARVGIWGKDDISVMGYGADRPIADNSTPEGMAQNRRVEITLLEDL